MSFAFDPPPKKPKHHVWVQHEAGWEDHGYHDDPDKAYEIAYKKAHQRYKSNDENQPGGIISSREAHELMRSDQKLGTLIWHFE